MLHDEIEEFVEDAVPAQLEVRPTSTMLHDEIEESVEDAVPVQLEVRPTTSRQLSNQLQPPLFGQINVQRSRGVVIGTQITNVTVDDEAKVKAKLLGIQLVSGVGRSRNLRCGFALCVCWMIIIAVAALAYVSYGFVVNAPTVIDVGLNESWYIRRGEWQAVEPNGIKFLDLPIGLVVMGHSVTRYCSDRRSCIDIARAIQKYHIMELRWADIGYNFMVGGGGIVLEGRGANVVGAMLTNWNHRIVSVGFLGDYTAGKDAADDGQLRNVEGLLARLVEQRVLSEDYRVVGACQITGDVNPGRGVARRLRELKHWDPADYSDCPDK